MACSSSHHLYKRAIRKDQGERSAVAFPMALNPLELINKYKIIPFDSSILQIFSSVIPLLKSVSKSPKLLGQLYIHRQNFTWNKIHTLSLVPNSYLFVRGFSRVTVKFWRNSTILVRAWSMFLLLDSSHAIDLLARLTTYGIISSQNHHNRRGGL